MTSVREWRPRLQPAVLGLLFGLLAMALAWRGSLKSTVTHDEIAHVVAGHSYWLFGDDRLQCENGRAPQLVAGLPVFLSGARFPENVDDAWRRSDVWTLARRHYYEIGNLPEWNTVLARTAATAWLGALVLLVYCWTNRMGGPLPATLAAAWIALDPNFLAHGGLATSDVPAAFSQIAALAALAWHLRKPGWPSALVSAICLGLSAVCKFSFVLLLPVAFVLITMTLLDLPRNERARRAKGMAVSFMLHAIVSSLIVWGFYGFGFSAVGPGMPEIEQFARSWDATLAADAAPIRAILEALRSSRLLPEAFLYGLANCLGFGGSHGAFAAGQATVGGWWWFFPYAFLVKTPIMLLSAIGGAFVGALCVLLRKNHFRRTLFADLAPLLTWTLVYGVLAVASGFNIGYRHLLPLLPALIVTTAILLTRLARMGRISPGWFWIFPLGALWTASSALSHPLSFFNVMAGGTDQGYRHLVDSSLDWGQDLGNLARYLERRPRPEAETVYLAYFGHGNPSYEGIRARRLPSLPVLEHYDRAPLQAGLYCISATLLQGPYTPGGRNWTREREQRYLWLRQLEKAGWPSIGDEDLSIARWHVYNWLRFTRLCIYLRTREPDTTIGGSILLYQLTADELTTALDPIAVRPPGPQEKLSGQ